MTIILFQKKCFLKKYKDFALEQSYELVGDLNNKAYKMVYLIIN